MEIKKVEPVFGMAVRRHPKTPAINDYLKNLAGRKLSIFRKVIRNELHNPVDVYMGIMDSGKKAKFFVEVNGEKFIENFFFGPISTLKMGVNYARKLALSK